MSPKYGKHDTKQERVSKPQEKRHEWVGLTDDEIDGLVANTRWHELIKATEAKLKQKNGYAEEKNGGNT
jgi:hypothetical protein